MNIALTRIPLLCWPYLFLLAVALVMPSDGNHGVFSIKSAMFFLSASAMCLLLLMQYRWRFANLPLAIFLCSLGAFLVAWSLVSAANSYGDNAAGLDQAKLFVVTIAIPAMGAILVAEGYLTSQTIFKTVFYANFLYCTAKVFLVLASLIGLISLWDVMDLLGIRFMQMGIYAGLERLQTSVDIVTPFILFFVLNSAFLGVRCNKFFIGAYLVASCFANFLSFSRFLIFVYMAALVLFVLTRPLRLFFRWAIALVAVLAAATAYIGLEPISQVVEKRLFSNDNYLSDEVRVRQMRYLWHEHEQYPWLGKGMGGYVEGFVRDYQLPHSYEVQWLAFVMQFGVLGVTILALWLLIIFWRFVTIPLSLTRLAFAALFALWIISGFTNPFLISLTSGVVYTLFFLAGRTEITPVRVENRKSHSILSTEVAISTQSKLPG